ncbi:MAG TPA: Flp pilus assembly protein CpaB [Clostridia bacterium]|nr:Flp pilus assembly protein CpaB [Clostridia bacterium]
MEKANKKIIIIAIVFALITAVLIYSYISGIDSKTTAAPKIDYATVYIAARTIPARTEITAADVKQVQIARQLLNASAVTDINEITGKRTLESIISGEQIVKERLADEKSMSLSYFIPEGTRAVSFNVNEQIDVANLIRPGDFVDIVASFEKEEEENGQTIKFYPRITKVILQRVQVLALGQDVVLPAEKLKDPPATVTLAIKQEDVEKFVFASEYGTLRLALRPLDDNSQDSTPGILRSDMTGTKGVYSRPSGNVSSAN